jgi:arsenate reductase
VIENRQITKSLNRKWLGDPMTRWLNDSKVSRPVHVLFVCYGNAARSQMAEALANHLGKENVRAFSAGSHPLGMILPETYEVLQEKGVSLDGHWSKGIEEVPVGEMDVVVSMGSEVTCPVPAGFQGRLIEWNIPDPCARDLEFFRSVRDFIERHVKTLLAGLETQRTEPLPPNSAPGA